MSDSYSSSYIPPESPTVTANDSIILNLAYTQNGGYIIRISVSLLRRLAVADEDLTIRLSNNFIGEIGVTEIVLDNKSIWSIVDVAGRNGYVTLTIDTLLQNNLTRVQRRQVGDNSVHEITIYAERKGEYVIDLKGGSISLTFRRNSTMGDYDFDRTVFYRNSVGDVKQSNIGEYHRRKNGINHVIVFTFDEI